MPIRSQVPYLFAISIRTCVKIDKVIERYREMGCLRHHVFPPIRVVITYNTGGSHAIKEEEITINLRMLLREKDVADVGTISAIVGRARTPVERFDDCGNEIAEKRERDYVYFRVIRARARFLRGLRKILHRTHACARGSAR
jgi:hypothetical protein